MPISDQVLPVGDQVLPGVRRQYSRNLGPTLEPSSVQFSVYTLLQIAKYTHHTFLNERERERDDRGVITTHTDFRMHVLPC